EFIPLRIRPATSADISTIVALERACETAAHWTDQQYLQLFQATPDAPQRIFLIAETCSIVMAEEETSRIDGFLIARNAAYEWELENIIVAPSARRKGLGKQLFESLLAHAKHSNDEAVYLEVRESNSAARNFYQRMGFQPTGTRKSYYANPSEDAI